MIGTSGGVCCANETLHHGRTPPDGSGATGSDEVQQAESYPWSCTASRKRWPSQERLSPSTLGLWDRGQASKTERKGKPVTRNVSFRSRSKMQRLWPDTPMRR